MPDTHQANLPLAATKNEISLTSFVSGNGIGKAAPYTPANFEEALAKETFTTAAEEIERFEAALQDVHERRRKAHEAAEQISETSGRKEDASTASLNEAVKMMLEDTGDYSIKTITKKFIEDKSLSATVAVKKAIDKYCTLLSASEDNKHLVIELEGVKTKFIERLLGISSLADYIKSCEGDSIVLFANRISPEEVLDIQEALEECPNKVCGVFVDTGESRDHAVILLKSMGIPYIRINDQVPIEKGNEVLFNTSTDRFLVNPAADQIKDHLRQIEIEKQQKRALPISIQAPITKDGVKINLSGALNLHSQAKSLHEKRANGVSLFRLEFMFLKGLITDEEAYKRLHEVVQVFSPQSVTFRLPDLGSDKMSVELKEQLGIEESELNPALGNRGIRLALQNKDKILRPAIKAILRASARSDARILVPMVTDQYEMLDVKKIIEEEKAKLAEAGLPYNKNIEIGAMIETPSSAELLHKILPLVDFVNIGLNDLSQYELAACRHSVQVHVQATDYHEATVEVLRRIRKKTDLHNAGQPADRIKHAVVCGELAVDPKFIPVLVGLGYRSFSVDEHSIEIVNHVVAMLDTKECEKLVHSIRHLDPEAGRHALNDLLTNFFNDLKLPDEVEEELRAYNEEQVGN